jgi:hypothetical protein
MLRLFAIVLLGAALATGTAAAQTAPTETNTDTTAPTNTDAGTPPPSDTGTPPPINTSDGATIALSLGNQKIARALFEAQTLNGETPALSLEEIAALKKGGLGWGQILKKMKDDGLIEERNLGQVVSKYQHRQKEIGTATGSALAGSHRAGNTHGTGLRSGSGHALGRAPGSAGPSGSGGHRSGNSAGGRSHGKR